MIPNFIQICMSFGSHVLCMCVFLQCVRLFVCNTLQHAMNWTCFLSLRSIFIKISYKNVFHTDICTINSCLMWVYLILFKLKDIDTETHLYRFIINYKTDTPNKTWIWNIHILMWFSVLIWMLGSESVDAGVEKSKRERYTDAMNRPAKKKCLPQTKIIMNT